MADNLKRVTAVLILTGYAMAVGPGAGAWIECSDGDGVHIESALNSCCLDQETTSHKEDRETTSCEGCTDTPIAFSDQAMPSPVMKAIPLACPVHSFELSLIVTKSNVTRPAYWDQLFPLADRDIISTIVLLC